MELQTTLRLISGKGKSMGWFLKAEVNGLVSKIKKMLKTHPFTKAIAEYYHIPIDEIDKNLQIEICDLDDKFAEGNGKVIRINKKLIDDEFFEKNFHFVVHEFFHWLKRRSEDLFYFNDPEEVQSFVMQIAWELIDGKREEDVIKEIYPIIYNHYKDKDKFIKVFNDMMGEAKRLYKIYKANNIK